MKMASTLHLQQYTDLHHVLVTLIFCVELVFCFKFVFLDFASQFSLKMFWVFLVSCNHYSHIHRHIFLAFVWSLLFVNWQDLVPCILL